MTPALPASLVEKIERELPTPHLDHPRCYHCIVLALFAEREALWRELDEAWREDAGSTRGYGMTGSLRSRTTAARRALELEP